MLVHEHAARVEEQMKPFFASMMDLYRQSKETEHLIIKMLLRETDTSWNALLDNLEHIWEANNKDP
jgi:hypothetical protein